MAEIDWLAPWYGVQDESEIVSLGAQLVLEIGPKHVLSGLSARLVARREDDDSCLFRLADDRFAFVHLTWRNSPEPDPQRPVAVIHDTFEAFAKTMRDDHAAQVARGG